MERDSFVPLAKVQDGVLFTIINDHIGTPREMLDASGRVVWAASFTAWGRVDRRTDPGSGHDCPIRFQGQWFDDESGLHYNRFRHYDPDTGRFISPDPIGLAGGLNLHQLTTNPSSSIDPLGLAPATPCAGPRFIVDEHGNTVDTHTTPPGSYSQPGGGRTDILQNEDHGAGLSHTHDPIVNTNPATGQTFINGLEKPGRPVSAQDVQNIANGTAPPAPPKGR